MAQQEGNGASTTDEAGNTYAVFGNQWVSYDTPKTVTEKVNKHFPKIEEKKGK